MCSYRVKIYDPVKRTKFSVKQMNNVKQRFKTVSALRSALWHEFEDLVPDEGNFNVGYFEGRQHTKKWLVSTKDLDEMYTHFSGKSCISLWCDGKEQEVDDGRKKKHNNKNSKKRTEKEDEVEDIFQKLKSMHGSDYSGPQLRLWARMVAANTHDDLDQPPKVPMITGGIQQRPRKDSFTEAVTSAATAIAKAFSPTPASVSPLSTANSPRKTADIRMKNLEQLRCLQQLRQDGILTEEEFITQKEIVLKSLSKLV